MNNRIKSFLAAAAAASSTLAPMASQFTAVSATRLSAVAAMSSVAVLTPSTAFAQSGKRMCGTVWDNSISGGGAAGLASIGMEVSKYDFVTCGGLFAAWVTLTSLPRGVTALAKSLFNNANGVGTGLIGNLRYNETCESFSRRVGANTGNVCLKMTDYKLYAFVNVGGKFGMGRI